MNGGPLENKSTRGRVSRISSLLNEKKKRGGKRKKEETEKKRGETKEKGREKDRNREWKNLYFK